MKKRNLLLFVLSAILLTNCKKEEEPIPFDNSCYTIVVPDTTGIPDTISRVTYNVRLKQDTHPYLKWTSGICNIIEITFDATFDGATQPTSFSTSTLTTINLFTGEATPVIITTDISPGNYTNVGITMQLFDDSTLYSIILNGEYTHTNNSIIPIRFLFISGEVFEATLASYFFPPATNTTCWLELDPNNWFSDSVVTRSDLDDASAILDSAGVMIISESVNTTVYDPVEEQIGLTTTSSGIIVCE